MKNFLLPLLMIVPIITFSQDIITLKTGKITTCKIDKITETDIEYHLWDNLSGPIFSISIKNVQDYKLQKQPVAESKSVASVEVRQSVPTKIVYDDVMIALNGEVSKVKIVNVSENKITFNKVLDGNNVVFDAKLESFESYKFAGKETMRINREIPQREVVKAPNPDVPSQSYTPKSTTSIVSNSYSTNSYSDMFDQGKNDAKIYYTGYKGAGTGTFFGAFLGGGILGLIPAIACSSTTPNENHLAFPNTSLARNPDYLRGYTQEAKRKKSRKVWGNYGIGLGSLLGVFILAAAGQKK